MSQYLFQVYPRLHPSVRSRLRQTEIPLSQAFLERDQLDQLPYLRRLWYRLPDYLDQALSDLYQSRERLMLRHLVSQARAESDLFQSVQTVMSRFLVFLRRDLLDLFLLPLARMLVLLGLLALQPLAQLRSRVSVTLMSLVLAVMAGSVMLLPLVLLMSL
jgi:hypothetical protein